MENIMNRSIYFLLFLSLSVQTCNNPIIINNIKRQDLIGLWHEADTSTGSEGWSFCDTIASHGFKGLDTIGYYLSWSIRNDTITLTNQQNKNEILLVNKINMDTINFKYYRWTEYIDKEFYKQ